MLTIAKFGGSSLADGIRFAAVREILQKDPARRGVVVSAPGKRNPEDTKVTDLLYLCHERRGQWGDWETVFDCIARRLVQIAGDCGFDLTGELEQLRQQVAQGVTRDYLASRGEYFSAKIMAAFLGWKFIDSAQWLYFTAAGTVDTVRSYGALRILADAPFVTPGFYGVGADGEIRTFPRGGSDITGALAAAAIEADLYENWTDVPGILQADPRLIPAAKPVPYLTYGELSELSQMGTQVLHEGAVRPVREAGIPLQIRSTLEPEAPGTLVRPALLPDTRRDSILGFFWRRERALISLSGRDVAPGALERSLREQGVVPDFFTSSLERQTASVPEGRAAEILDQMGTQTGRLHVRDGLALLGVLFSREARDGPRASELLGVLKEEKIPVEAILRPFGGHTLLLAVPDGTCERAVRKMWEVSDG